MLSLKQCLSQGGHTAATELPSTSSDTSMRIKQSSSLTLTMVIFGKEQPRFGYVQRGVSRANNEFNFLGFKCKESNQLDTHITGGFSLISDWPHLHHLATKAGLQVI